MAKAPGATGRLPNGVYPGQRTRAQLESGQWEFAGLEPVPFCAATTDARPISVYGATKLAQEQVLRAWACAFGIEATVLRLQNVYGPGQSLHNPYTGICTLFAQLARAGKSVPLYEDGLIVRDFVFIDDVVSALAASLRCENSALAYDIGSGPRHHRGASGRRGRAALRRATAARERGVPARRRTPCPRAASNLLRARWRGSRRSRSPTASASSAPGSIPKSSRRVRTQQPPERSCVSNFSRRGVFPCPP